MRSTADEEYVHISEQLRETIARLEGLGELAKQLGIELGTLQAKIEEKTRLQAEAQQYEPDRRLVVENPTMPVHFYPAASANIQLLFLSLVCDMPSIQQSH
jgi:hypothetical protein